MRNSNRPRPRISRLINLNSVDTSPPSKRLDASGLVSAKSTAGVSKYSLFHSSYQQKILKKELEKHGPSLVYNFRYHNIMGNSVRERPSADSGRLPTLNLSESPMSRKSDSIMAISGHFEAYNPNIQSNRGSTEQLKGRITKFLKMEVGGETQKALDSFENEIAFLKEKHKVQRENIYKVLKVTELEQLNQRTRDLTMQNVRKYFPSTRQIEPSAELNLTAESPKSLPKNPSKPSLQNLDAKPRFRLLNPDQPRNPTPLLKTNNFLSPTTDPKTLSLSLKPSFASKSGKSIKSIQREPSQAEPLVDESGKVNKKRLDFMLETTRKSLDAKLALYKFESPKSVRVADLGLVSTIAKKAIYKLRMPREMKMIHSVHLKFVEAVKTLIKKMDILNLTLNQIWEHKVFPSKPYEREGSIELIKSSKIGDYDKISKLLKENKYLVYDYDPMDQTALHWAVKRGHSKIAKLLLDNGADPDARDVSKRTPLFFAAKSGHLKCVKLLLWYRANPMLKSISGVMAIDCTKNDRIKLVIRRAYRMQLILELCSPKKYKLTWEKIDKGEFELLNSELE